MSKCKPSIGEIALSKGIEIEDQPAENGSERLVLVKIPYDKLLNDASISQLRVSDLVKIAIQETAK
jgi:hypothetical protein